MRTQKTLKFLFAIAGSLAFIAQGIYILNTNQTTTGQFIGYANIIFFGSLVIWAFLKFTNKKSNNL